MKNAIIWIMCLIVVAAAALIITDKVVELTGRRPKPVEPAPVVAPAKGDPALAERLGRVEKVLDEVRRMLSIPEISPEDRETMGTTRDGANPGPPPSAGIGERLQWIESELSDLRRQSNRDLMQIYTRLRRRLDEMEAKLLKPNAPDSRATAKDLKKRGVDWDPGKNLITMEAAFIHPTRVLEFIAVAEGGSAHESLLLLNAQPSALKRAIELMGVREAPDPPYDLAKMPKDCFVYLYASWPGRTTPIRVEKLLRNGTTGKVLEPGPFVFTASHPFVDPRTWDEFLAADLHRNAIALTWNYAAEGVIACPAANAANENIWSPAEDILPQPPSPATLYVSKEPVPEWDK